MRNNFLALVIAIAGLLLVTVAGPATAITYTVGLNDTVSFPTTSYGFQTPDFGSGNVDYATGSVGGQYRSPWDLEGAPYNSLPYTSVRNGTVGYNLTGMMLSLFWGSIDTYNSLTFWTLAEGTGEFVSVDVSALGDPFSGGHHLVQFFTDVPFQSVTLGSGQAAFEFANLTTTPIPPALLLFLTGLGGLGWLGRKKAPAAA
jgi:hypothetical protein